MITVFLTWLAFFFIVFIIGLMVRPVKSSGDGVLVLGVNHTDALKGISIIFVMSAHMGSSIGINGLQFIAGIGVGLFLFCSGYGLTKSFQKHGMKGFWLRRFFRILVPCWLIRFFFIIINPPYKQNILYDIFFSSYVWYITYIIIAYIAFGIIFTLKMSDKSRLILIFLFFAAFFVKECFYPMNPTVPFLAARQMLCFPMGVLIALYGKTGIIKKIHDLSKLKTLLLSIALLILGCAFMGLTQLPIIKNESVIAYDIVYFLANTPLVAGTLLLTIVFGFIMKSVTLKLLGKMSYELMLAHFCYLFTEADIFHLFRFIVLTGVTAVVLYIIDKYIFKALGKVS